MDELDEKLQELANEYHAPGDVPREEMWARIKKERVTGNRLPVAGNSRPRLRYVTWAVGLAATLLLGVLIGRSTQPAGYAARQPADSSAAAGGRTTSPAAINVAARAHLRQSEAYLTLFRSSVRQGDLNDLGIPAARQLLATNRLLMNAPGTDPRLRALMGDLDLILAEIAQLQASERPEDIELITDGLDRAGVLTRLRTATPPTPGAPIPMGVS